MISEKVFLWICLPREIEPVVCGVVAFNGYEHVFRYARSYLERNDAIPLAPPGRPLGELTDDEYVLDAELNSAIRDASPDAWGRNVMLREYANAPGRKQGELGEIDFLLRAGPDRIGALDGAEIDAVARHPLGRESDLTLRFRPEGTGLYLSDRPLPAGRWKIHLEVRRGRDALRAIETLS